MQKRRDLVSGLVFIALGAAWVAYGLRYPVGTLMRPGPGLVPLAAGILLMLLSAQLLLSSLPAVLGAAGRQATTAVTGRERVEHRKPMLMLAALAAYVYTLGWSGYLANTLLVVLLGIRIMGGRNWVMSLLVATGVAIATYLLFMVFLDVPLPPGELIPAPFRER